MKIIKFEMSNTTENYLNRIRPVMPEYMQRMNDSDLINCIMESSAMIIENIPDELLRQYCEELGKIAIDKINNPNSQTINIPKN